MTRDIDCHDTAESRLLVLASIIDVDKSHGKRGLFRISFMGIGELSGAA